MAKDKKSSDSTTEASGDPLEGQKISGAAGKSSDDREPPRRSSTNRTSGDAATAAAKRDSRHTSFKRRTLQTGSVADSSTSLDVLPKRETIMDYETIEEVALQREEERRRKMLQTVDETSKHTNSGSAPQQRRSTQAKRVTNPSTTTADGPTGGQTLPTGGRQTLTVSGGSPAKRVTNPSSTSEYSTGGSLGNKQSLTASGGHAAKKASNTATSSGEGATGESATVIKKPSRGTSDSKLVSEEEQTAVRIENISGTRQPDSSPAYRDTTFSGKHDTSKSKTTTSDRNQRTETSVGAKQELAAISEHKPSGGEESSSPESRKTGHSVRTSSRKSSMMKQSPVVDSGDTTSENNVQSVGAQSPAEPAKKHSGESASVVESNQEAVAFEAETPSGNGDSTSWSKLSEGERERRRADKQKEQNRDKVKVGGVSGRTEQQQYQAAPNNMPYGGDAFLKKQQKLRKQKEKPLISIGFFPEKIPPEPEESDSDSGDAVCGQTTSASENKIIELKENFFSISKRIKSFQSTSGTFSKGLQSLTGKFKTPEDIEHLLKGSNLDNDVQRRSLIQFLEIRDDMETLARKMEMYFSEDCSNSRVGSRQHAEVKQLAKALIGQLRATSSSSFDFSRVQPGACEVSGVILAAEGSDSLRGALSFLPHLEKMSGRALDALRKVASFEDAAVDVTRRRQFLREQQERKRQAFEKLVYTEKDAQLDSQNARILTKRDKILGFNTLRSRLNSLDCGTDTTLHALNSLNESWAGGARVCDFRRQMHRADIDAIMRAKRQRLLNMDISTRPTPTFQHIF